MARKIIYWITTLWLASGMLGSGYLQLSKQAAPGAVSPPGTEGIAVLGYPVYFLTIIGVWKVLGAVALLIPRFPVLKEWAYAGFVFLTTGALYSHVAVGHEIKYMIPAFLLLCATIVSWALRPLHRKITKLG